MIVVRFLSATMSTTAATKVMTHINDAAATNALNLCATALLASRQRNDEAVMALDEGDERSANGVVRRASRVGARLVVLCRWLSPNKTTPVDANKRQVDRGHVCFR